MYCIVITSPSLDRMEWKHSIFVQRTQVHLFCHSPSVKGETETRYNIKEETWTWRNVNLQHKYIWSFIISNYSSSWVVTVMERQNLSSHCQIHPSEHPSTSQPMHPYFPPGYTQGTLLSTLNCGIGDLSNVNRIPGLWAQ